MLRPDLKKIIFPSRIINLKTTTFISISFFVCNTTIAQSIVMQSINSGAANMNQANGSLSFTVGELLVSTQIDSQGNSLGVGNNATSVYSAMTILETDKKLLDVKVYPNPSSNILNIQVNYASIEYFNICICDVQGKLVYHEKHAGISNIIRINTTDYKKGNYIISLKNLNNQLLGTYKLIKI